MGLDAADIGKANTMNFNIVGVDNVCAVLAPKVHPLNYPPETSFVKRDAISQIKGLPFHKSRGDRFTNQGVSLIRKTDMVDLMFIRVKFGR